MDGLLDRLLAVGSFNSYRFLSCVWPVGNLLENHAFIIVKVECFSGREHFHTERNFGIEATPCLPGEGCMQKYISN